MSNSLASLKQQYDEQGYLVVPELFPAEFVARLRETTRSFVEQAQRDELDDPLFDLIRDREGISQLRRITSPEQVHPIYDEAMRFEPLVDIVAELLGGTVRFDHGKLNFKPPSGGVALEWHQDWAFYPQTNDDMLAIGLMIEDCTLENGPLMVIPGSHRGPVYDHNQNGEFVGAVRAQDLGGELNKAVTLTAPAGSVSVHHVRTLHASMANRSTTNRPLCLFSYAAVDAFPIFHRYEWTEFNARILRGEETNQPRLVANPVRVSEPTPPSPDGYQSRSIFHVQANMEDGALFN